MVEALPLRIFLATPGDLADERRVISICIEEYNRRWKNTDTAKFEVVGWESVRGTARRPQEAINELISECHYLISLFKSSWGSEPGSPWGYTSGTEEELFTGLLELSQADQPMRDIWVGFVSSESVSRQISALQDQMSRNHALMYEVLTDIPSLKSKLNERLEGWAATASTKIARQIDLLPSSGKDVLRAATLRLEGEKLVELGLPAIGRDKLKEAAVLGGPPEQLAYARFLSRSGEFDSARASVQEAIDYFVIGSGQLKSPMAADAFAALAGIMRREGDYRGAIGRLQHALTLLDVDDPYATSVRCRILDDIGLAYQKLDEVENARDNFDSALQARRNRGVAIDVYQSLVNIARIEVANDEIEKALGHADEALVGLRKLPPSSLLANAEVLRAQICLRESRPDEALENANRAMSINQQIGNKLGIAISHQVSAQCFRAAGQPSEALFHAEESLKINQSMGNEFGASRATWLIDQLREDAST